MALDKLPKRIATLDHIHTPDDGRGIRDVYVDGRKIDHVVYADTGRGVVDAYLYPFKVNWKGDHLNTRRLKGKVEVVPVHE